MPEKIYQLAEQHLPKIVAIERQQVFAWAETQFQECLAAGYECVVLEIDKQIIGFAIFSIANDESEILNIAIDKSQRRHGYGRLLIEFVLQQAQNKGAKKVFLEVRISNFAAIGLYEKLGFQRVGYRKDYYRAENGREDAIILGFIFPGL